MGIPSIFNLLIQWTGLQYEPKLKPTPSPLPSPLFKSGDWVTLKKENPFKGTLICGKAYQVGRVIPTHMALVGENETVGYYSSQHFKLLGYDPNPPGAQEYDEIMQIQDLMS